MVIIRLCYLHPQSCMMDSTCRIALVCLWIGNWTFTFNCLCQAVSVDAVKVFDSDIVKFKPIGC